MRRHARLSRLEDRVERRLAPIEGGLNYTFINSAPPPYVRGPILTFSG